MGKKVSGEGFPHSCPHRGVVGEPSPTRANPTPIPRSVALPEPSVAEQMLSELKDDLLS